MFTDKEPCIFKFLHCFYIVFTSVFFCLDSTLSFQKNSYATVNKNQLVKPRITFSNKIDYSIQGFIQKEPGTAVGK